METQEVHGALNTEAAQLTSTISEQLFNQLKHWGYCDLVLDRELSDPLHGDLASIASDQRIQLINPKIATVSPEQCLMLVRLTLKELSVLERSIEIALRQNTDPTRPVRAIGGWLFSQESTQERLARKLEQAIIVHIQRHHHALLRIWDPRVIGHLPRILLPEQITTLLGDAAVWSWVNRAGQLEHLQKQTPPPQFPILRLQLTAEQDAAVDRIEYINALLKALAQLGHRVPPNRDHELDDVVLTAQRKGHCNMPDILTYCLHALLVSPTFDEIPDVHMAVAHARTEGKGLCAALEQFNDSYWAQHRSSPLL